MQNPQRGFLGTHQIFIQWQNRNVSWKNQLSAFFSMFIMVSWLMLLYYKTYSISYYDIVPLSVIHAHTYAKYNVSVYSNGIDALSPIQPRPELYISHKLHFLEIRNKSVISSAMVSNVCGGDELKVVIMYRYSRNVLKNSICKLMIWISGSYKLYERCKGLVWLYYTYRYTKVISKTSIIMMDWVRTSPIWIFFKKLLLCNMWMHGYLLDTNDVIMWL